MVTLEVCSFKWETSSLDLISHTLHSPSIPPEQINFWLNDNEIAVTPFLWALSIYHKGDEPSILKDLIRPSDHPEIITSSVNTEQRGKTPAVVRTEQRAVTE